MEAQKCWCTPILDNTVENWIKWGARSIRAWAIWNFKEVLDNILFSCSPAPTVVSGIQEDILRLSLEEFEAQKCWCAPMSCIWWRQCSRVLVLLRDVFPPTLREAQKRWYPPALLSEAKQDARSIRASVISKLGSLREGKAQKCWSSRVLVQFEPGPFDAILKRSFREGKAQKRWELVRFEHVPYLKSGGSLFDHHFLFGNMAQHTEAKFERV
ncbi:hypothetical protein C8R46DRAFT_1041105 [Mycena filopes]|nr:hypothetical protein C8R46DRAFT_1041105 [Mycena filopes]